MHTLGVESSFLNWGKSDFVFKGFRMNASALIFLIPLLFWQEGLLLELEEVVVVVFKYFCTLGGEGVDVLGAEFKSDAVGDLVSDSDFLQTLLSRLGSVLTSKASSSLA